MLKKLRQALNGQGFTLIELMVVITIVGLLSAIAILEFKNYHEKSHNTAALNDIRNVETLVHGFYADYKHYP